MSDTAFGAYSYHTTKIEELINRLAMEEDPNDPWVQNRICGEIGLYLDHLTDAEISYIEEEIAKRL